MNAIEVAKGYIMMEIGRHKSTESGISLQHNIRLISALIRIVSNGLLHEVQRASLFLSGYSQACNDIADPLMMDRIVTIYYPRQKLMKDTLAYLEMCTPGTKISPEQSSSKRVCW